MAYELVIDFPGKTFYQRFADQFPVVRQFPVLYVPAEQATPEQLQATPATYQFSTPDAAQSIFIGPRMATANVRVWRGYPAYRDFVGAVFSAFFELNSAPLERYSLGFYNRIPVSNVDDIRQILTGQLDLRDDVVLQELVTQSVRNTDAGEVVTQIATNSPDSFTKTPFLSINNIIRSSVSKGDMRNPEALLSWLDVAHELGKEMIWRILSEQVKENWKPQDAR